MDVIEEDKFKSTTLEEEDENDCFQVNDLEFCTTCGTILPLLTNQDYLTCRLCKKSIQINRKIFI